LGRLAESTLNCAQGWPNPRLRRGSDTGQVIAASRCDPPRVRRSAHRWLLVALIVGCLGAVVAPVASAATTAAGDGGSTGATGTTGAVGLSPATDPVMSSNWAGYAITGTRGTVRKFKRVAASWVQPAATCTPGTATYSAFWVGLGGLAASARKLEQTGTEADCDRDGLAHYSAWYELVPAGPVTLRLAVSPGDAISASVAVWGAYVTVKLNDATTGGSIVKRLHFAHANLGSAEWIAEAPSNCAGACRALPLTNFGSIEFSRASAKTRDGHGGAISNPAWAREAIALNERGRAPGSGRFLGPPDLATAVPTVLDVTGSAFAVSWAQPQPALGDPGGQFLAGAAA
jgi:Peptidase A4 family